MNSAPLQSMESGFFVVANKRNSVYGNRKEGNQLEIVRDIVLERIANSVKSPYYEQHELGVVTVILRSRVLGNLFSLSGDGFLSSQYLSANSSTTNFENALAIRQFLDRAIIEARSELFKTGYDSNFSEKLQLMFSCYPEQTLMLLNEKIVNDSKVSPQTLAEIMRWLSRLETKSVRQQVVVLLVAGLNHYSSLVRDEASIALANLEEKRAIPILNKAVESESNPTLRQDILDLIASL